MSKAIIPGSVGAIAARNGKAIAETFVNCDIIVMIDVSGSMQNTLAGGETRYERACKELANIQNAMPGKIGVIAFSTHPQFCPDGNPPFYGSTTGIAEVLKFAKIADLPGMRFILISDGEPDNAQAALNVAKTYQNKIDVVFIGDERDGGRLFLNELARLTGGSSATGTAAQLADKIQTLLLSEKVM